MRYTFEEHLKPIVMGEVPLPNFEPMDQSLFLRNLSACGSSMEPHWGWALIDGKRVWAYFFLQGVGMGSPPHTYGGNGYILIYPEKVGTFAICRHTQVEGAGANHRRGWHPGRCSKCGVDMSIDSGD
jgi:hypothetical protein